ncbi:hypothetical protein J2S49_001431 [Arcanobacterium wilhelmae]|uniref:DUF4350 domain-containing protein n=1 Tax=Arcanobacterium wilhelmae TaxID=1803177 RepID=A0ABT9NCB9_9ACTO|nr:DUF4350 domain-containing protein [Arcanobacterium wilhelmae]MDP9801355.1 hypothetical protein [Arcanobacterium wilhelmae]WFN90692.1 hypothetical protein P8A24_02210 [Arcanobacterium wilhelmae]
MSKRRWFALAVVLTLLVTLIIALTPGQPRKEAYAPDSVMPEGAGAFAALLEDRGASIAFHYSISDAVQTADSSTLIAIPWSVASALSTEHAEILRNSGARIVIFSDATTASLKHWGIDLTPRWAGAPTASGSGYSATVIGPISQVIDGPGTFPAAGGVVVGERAGLTLVADGSLLTNEKLAKNHNAALGLELFDSPSILWVSVNAVWSPAAPTPAPTLTYPWVIPTLIAACGVVLFAGAYAGRRFGPLVAERLPSAVDSRESRRGLALLYSKSADPARAAAVLRADAIARLAPSAGIARNASPDVVVATLSAHTGVEPAQLMNLLYTRPITTDAQLVEIQRELEGIS